MRSAYADLVAQATDREPDAEEIAAMSAYQMAATVEFGLDAKQGLLDLRSETARLRLLLRLFRAAVRRLDFVDARAGASAVQRQGAAWSAAAVRDRLADISARCLQTSSITVFVNATARSNVFGPAPREVSEKATLPACVLTT